ncbi:hypothetical protein BC938DRAFT_483530, partial [Jimgerdemannia flammicorona]
MTFAEKIVYQSRTTKFMASTKTIMSNNEDRKRNRPAAADEPLEGSPKARATTTRRSRCMKEHEKVLGSGHLDTNILNDLAGLYLRQGKYDMAGPLYERALATQEKVLKQDHLATALSLNNLAELYIRQHSPTIVSLISLAWLYQSQGKYDKAKVQYGLEHLKTALTLKNLARCRGE